MQNVPSEIHVCVLKIVQEQTHYSSDLLDFDKDLEGELGIDSLAFLNIMTDVGKQFAITTESVTIRQCNTMRKIVEYVADQLDKTSKIPPANKASSMTDVIDKGTISKTDDAENESKSDRTHGVDKGAVPKSNREIPDGERPVHTSLKDILREALGREDKNLKVDETFLRQGISEFQKRQLMAKILQKLKIPGALDIESCDTIEKLTNYLNAARLHSPMDISAQQIPYQPCEEDITDGDKSLRDFLEWKSQDLFEKTRHFNAFFQKRRRQNLYWYGMPTETPVSNRAVIYDENTGQHREFIIMSSNNYLGLANHPKVIEAICGAYKKYGATNTGCRMIGGTNLLHKELEKKLAKFKSTQACIVFPSGYCANLGAISALVRKNDAVITDKVNHMSILDGCKLSGGQIKIYQHNDMDGLEDVLKKCEGTVDGKLIVTDGVFSMHGDICDLPNIVKLARQYGARVMVDDAHATGVLGSTGAGTAEYYHMQGEVDLEMGTMSKALAGVGGFVAGDEDVIEYLRFYANSYVFAATIPAGVAAGLIAALDVLQNEPERIRRLWSNIRYLKENLQYLGFDMGNTQSAIIPVLIGDDYKTLRMGRAIRSRGLFAQTVVFPGVSKGEGRLRLSLMSEHTKEDLDLATEILADCGKKEGLIN